MLTCVHFTLLHSSLLFFRSTNSVLFLLCHAQVSYHLRFSFTPRNAPPKEKSELNPNSDLDWHTLSLFPLFQLPGPREQYDKEGGTPGWAPSPHLPSRLPLFDLPCLCFSVSVSPTFFPLLLPILPCKANHCVCFDDT